MNLLIAQMQEDDFPNYLAHTSQEYAKEKIKTGTWPADQALILAQAEIRSLLPQGMHTPNHHFLSLIDESGIKLGIFWLHLAPVQKEAFIYDFEIYEPFRGHKLGQLAMQNLFDYCRALGICKISLHVFAHNQRAYHVYKKLGFIETDINMTRLLH
ncbi:MULTISPECIES: GNAT family N-acetyltransferase [Sporolactobacillus]|uniref:N-acetyltransferase domain-containing protein n=2 Tax=Sporolactobacillus TaxID=2077 RepID=A0A0U1QPW1_9BACL|nr:MULTISPECIES: GNAT family N-acetyltransferase [Sporolactobacillus]KLI02825.1 hypothetical protein SINU_05745 [Sporolactobacillus inulinus CASD]BBN99485.1 putative N-acetyltransferase YycN [Sporolactobacillus terrae]GEB75772.1 putative N-acetyltransferase YycN [Sporolactobacillus inulinus]